MILGPKSHRPVNDGGTLLSNQDTSVYALLAGRSGGQIINGSQTTGQTLTLYNNSVDQLGITIDASGNVQTSGVIGMGNSPLSYRGVRVAVGLSGNATQAGVQSAVQFGSDATTASGLQSVNSIATGATVTNYYGFRLNGVALIGTATVTNEYGISIPNLTSGSTLIAAFAGAVTSGSGKYNLYMSGDAQNYLAGNLGIGTNAPARGLHLSAASDTASIRVDRLDDTSGPFNILVRYNAAGSAVQQSWGFGFPGGTQFVISNMGTAVTGTGTTILTAKTDGKVIAGPGTSDDAHLNAAVASASVFMMERLSSNGNVAGLLKNTDGTTYWGKPSSAQFAIGASSNLTSSPYFHIDNSGNIGLNATTFGTSAAKVLAIGNGTEPSTSPADAIQLYSVDLSAGNATLGLRTETAVTSAAAGASDAYLNVRINGTTYKLLLHT